MGARTTLRTDTHNSETMNRRRFLKLLGAALGAAEFFGAPSGWLEPIKARIHIGTYTGDGATSRVIHLGFQPDYIRLYRVNKDTPREDAFIVDCVPVERAYLKTLKETGKPSGEFNVKGEKYRYKVVE